MHSMKRFHRPSWPWPIQATDGDLQSQWHSRGRDLLEPRQRMCGREYSMVETAIDSG